MTGRGGDPEGGGPLTSPWADAWVVEALRACGLLDAGAVAKVEANAASTAWKACIAAGAASNADILEALSGRFRMPIADTTTLDPAVAEHMPERSARKLAVAPLRVLGRTLDVAVSDPTNASALDAEVAFAASMRVRLLLADPDTVRRCLDALYPNAEGIVIGADLEDGDGMLREMSAWTEAGSSCYSTSEIVDALIIQAVSRGASDIHLEPHEGSLGVRYRIDGMLYEVARMPPSLGPAVVSRIKVLANMDIADRIRPQDGRAQLRSGGRRIDLRISTLPVRGLGEKAVVRILDSGTSVHTLATLGYLPEELKRMDYLYRMSEGLVLVTGPTGSGKTTTLYAALRSVQTPGINIVTVEDPIEYRIEGVSQVQVNERAGLTFASVLRSILRQDPDVVLVGEIRDRETAEIAVQASMTGHLVLSTLHTNDAPSSIMRLVDIGVDLGSLASSIKGVVAQRLLRRLCPSCRQPCDISTLAANQRLLLEHLEDPQLFVPGGCGECGGTGYRGRLVVPELALVTPDVERAIASRAGHDEIAALCVAGGMRTFWESGLERVASGESSLNELLDNIYPPLDDDGTSGRTLEAEGDAETGPVTDTLGQEDVDAVFQEFSLRLEPATPATVATPTTVAVVATPVAPASRPPRRGDGESLRVLLIDEDAECRRELRKALESDGFRVLEAATGDAGLDYLRRIRPDFVILELTLPNVDGLSILRALAAEDSAAPTAVVLTVNDDPDLAAWAIELGAHDVLVKPAVPRLMGARLLASRHVAA